MRSDPAGSRRPPDSASGELRLPRAPGIIRLFWARHPRLTDVLVALVTAALTFGPPGRLVVPALWDALQPIATLLLVAGCITLLLRRRWPLVPFILAAAGTALAIPAGAGAGLVLLAVATYAVAVHRSSRAAVIAAVSTAVVGLLIAIWMTMAGGLPLQSALNAWLSLGLDLLVAALVGVNIGNRRRYVAAILDTSRQLWNEREQHARLAAAAERTRIAREMHDVVSHSLTVVVALAEGATATPDAERSRAATARIASTARAALDEMRAMLGVLRTDGDPDAPLAPLDTDAVGSAIAAARSAGIPVVLHTTGPAVGDLHARLAVARVVQEGLTNIIRHAPDAREAAVTIANTPDGVSVEIVNDAVTAPPSEGGYGVRGLHERAARLGGTAEAGPVRGGRWRVHLQLPPDPAGSGESPASTDAADASTNARTAS